MSSRPAGRRSSSIAAICLMVSSCGGAGTTTSSSVPPSTTAAPSITTTTTAAPVTTTTLPATSTTGPVETTTTAPSATGEATVLIANAGAMGAAWEESLFIEYGEADDLLGTAPGGENLLLGPDYGTQTPDGVWWFYDAAKKRIATYDSGGSYLGAYAVPGDVLVQGQYFQYQNPQALDDGRIVGSSLNTGRLLVVDDGEMTTIGFGGGSTFTTTDGQSLFGFTLGTSDAVRVDPSTGTPEPVDAFLTRAGTPYTFALERGEASVSFPESGIGRDIHIRWAADPDSLAFGAVEVESTRDGTLFVLFYGAPQADESQQIAGFFTIGADGSVSSADELADPFTPADPGSPAHLGVDLRTGRAWYMIIGEDGVHVYTRTG